MLAVIPDILQTSPYKLSSRVGNRSLKRIMLLLTQRPFSVAILFGRLQEV